MNQNGIDMQVCVEGRPIREFGTEGRTIVEGRKGVPFTVKVRNNHPVRVHVSVLVDGVGVVSGNAKDLRGYILEAYSSYEIKGWRRSLNDVASFVFETKDKSYTKAVKGSDAQCGVISLVAHAEKAKPQPPQIIEKHIHHDHHHHHDHWVDYWPYRRPWYPTYPPYPAIYCSTDGVTGTMGPSGCAGSTSNTMGGAGASASGRASTGTLRSMNFVSQSGGSGHVKGDDSVATFHVSSEDPSFSATMSVSGAEVSASVMNLGTGWGAQQLDSVHEVAWENGTKLATMELYYTDVRGLKHLGIDVNKTPSLPKTANFPSGLTGTGFCQPPPFEYAGEPPTPSGTKKQPVKARKKSLTKR